MAIAVWIFDFLILQMLPFFSIVLLLIGIIGVTNRLPGTVTTYVKAQGAKLGAAFRRERR